MASKSMVRARARVSGMVVPKHSVFSVAQSRAERDSQPADRLPAQQVSAVGRREVTLDGGVVVAVARTAHALGDAPLRELVTESVAGVLAAAVAVMEQVAQIVTTSRCQGALQGAVRQLGGEAGAPASQPMMRRL